MSRRRPRIVRNKGVIAAARAQRAPDRHARLTFQTDPLTRRVVRPLLIALLAASVAAALLVLADILTPGPPWMALLWLCFFAALEGAYTTAWLNNPDSRGVERGIYRAAEVVLLLLLARLVSWPLFGEGIPTPDDVRVYLGAPLSFFMTGNFFSAALVTLLTWWFAVTVSRIFAQLDVSADEVQFYTLSLPEQSAQSDNRPIQIARGELQEQYLRLWLMVGVAMIILAALSTYEVRELATTMNPFDIARLGLRPAILSGLMIYFLTGLWLLSHARLLRMNARWLMDGVAKEASLERAWQRNALALLAIIAFAAAFLPIGSTLGISRILSVIVGGGVYVVGLLYSMIGYLFAAVLMMLTRNASEAPVTPPQMTPVPPPPPLPMEPAAPSPVVGIIFSSFFWTLLVALVVGALLFFLRERGYRLDRARVQRSLASLWDFLRIVWDRMRGRVRSAGRSLRARLDSLPPALNTPPLTTPRRRFLRLNALSPREQIRYYYLATVRRASERGVPRAPNETPLEYFGDLKQGWPEAEPDLEQLTSAFLEARYSAEPMDTTVAGRVRERWKRVKDRLRGK